MHCTCSVDLLRPFPCQPRNHFISFRFISSAQLLCDIPLSVHRLIVFYSYLSSAFTYSSRPTKQVFHSHLVLSRTHSHHISRLHITMTRRTLLFVLTLVDVCTYVHGGFIWSSGCSTTTMTDIQHVLTRTPQVPSL